MIRIVNWSRHQHYKDRTPPWIKVYRKLLKNPVFLRADGDTVKVLIVLWLVAGETKNGEIVENPEDIAFVYHLDPAALARSLIYLHANKFVECASNVLAWCKQLATPETETETEKETEKLQPSLPPVTQPSTGDVENSSDSAEDEKQEPDGGDYSVRITDSKLRQEALSGMGAGKFTSALDQRRVDREVQDMIHTIDRENLLAAMRGFARLRDKGEVGLQPGKAYTPRVLLAWGKKGVWWGEGDQRTQRNFLDLCQEVGRMEQEPKTQRRGGMDSMADVLAQLTTPGEA